MDKLWWAISTSEAMSQWTDWVADHGLVGMLVALLAFFGLVIPLTGLMMGFLFLVIERPWIRRKKLAVIREGEWEATAGHYENTMLPIVVGSVIVPQQHRIYVVDQWTRK